MQLLLFQTGGRLLALPAREVREVLLRPFLTRRGDEPPWLEGFFHLEGEPVGVLRSDRILGQGVEDSRTLYTHLIVLRAEPIALSIERAREVLAVSSEQLEPPEPPPHPAVAATVVTPTQRMPLVSSRRLLDDEQRGELRRRAGEHL